jgi:hypothetical protein
MLHMKPFSSSIPMLRVHTTTLLDEDVHLKEMLVAQLDLLQQQAAMDMKQIWEELFELKNRIKWLENRAMERQVEPPETLSTPTSSQRHQRVLLQPLQQDPNNIMIPSLHPVPSQQDVWETWNRCRHEGARWGQLNRDHDDLHNNEDNAENTTPEISDDEADLATILDLPPAKSEGENIMNDDSEAANNMTKIDMTGDLITMYEDVTTVNMQGLHTGVNDEDIFTKKELPANNTHQVARCDDIHMNVDTMCVTTFKPEVYEAACKMTNQTGLRGTEMLADNTYLQALNETYLEEDVDKTFPEINIEKITIMRAGTNKPPGTATFGMKGLHTREKEEDHFAREEPPANNKVLAKYEYEDKPNMQDVPNMPPQEELSTDDGVLTKYEYSTVGM